ncbi:hypothetical protein BCR35DRAFT_306174 [Leucosporidium creatinivorum]|uniref:CFEM domain-containing protein n=1 Tax=Leucosporidium creatinivorum TaxID=106004 RepID=A0A1Y2EVP4_9BASI|nr:hypothetical protein BCR35DRAFT_306174 [Leucosporidium creatinivorum]
MLNLRLSASLLALAFVGLALAQSNVTSSPTSTSSAATTASTAAVPSCALSCVLTSLPNTGCASYGVTNITCICTDAPFQLAYYECQQSSCSADDLQKALAYGAQTCSENNTPITTSAIPSGASSKSASSTSSGTSASRSATGVSSSASTAATSAPASSGLKSSEFGAGSAMMLGVSMVAVLGGVGLLL